MMCLASYHSFVVSRFFVSLKFHRIYRFYSPYVSSRLSVWKTHGKAKLHELFAKLGVSLEQCKQKWSFLSQQSRNNVLQQMKDHSSNFDLPNLNYSAFQRCKGFSARVSAADVVHATTALLETKNSTGSAPQQAIDGTSEDGNQWLDSFWTAYDVLLVKDDSVLQRGIDVSMRQQREIVSKAVAIIEKRTCVALKHFRYSYLTKTTGLGVTDDMFTQPMALTNLAHFLVEIHRQNGKWLGPKARPLLLLVCAVLESNDGCAIKMK
jgi:cell division control protein 45